MTIAILGWGSLIWEKGVLKLKDGRWRDDGPLLPVEFAHISERRHGALTLVLWKRASRDVPTLWAVSEFDSSDLDDNLDKARRNLAEREGTPDLDRIGFLRRDGKFQMRSMQVDEPRLDTASPADPVRDASHERADRLESLLQERIGRWLKSRNLDAVIWTDLSANYFAGDFFKQSGGVLSPESAVAYLKELRRSDTAGAQAAEDYVRNAPGQVRTGIRERIEEDSELRWLPREVAPSQAATAAIDAGTPAKSGQTPRLDTNVQDSPDLARYIKYRWEPKHTLLSEQARFNKRWNQALQLTGGLCAVSVTALIGFGEPAVPKAIPAVLSAVVAGVTVAERVFKFGDNWRSTRRAAEMLRRERALLVARAGLYKDPANSLAAFANQCELALRQIAEEPSQPSRDGPQKAANNHWGS